MNRVFWALTYAGLFVAVVLQIADTIAFMQQYNPLILTTPYGLALIPVSFSIPEGAFYLRPFIEPAPTTHDLKYLQVLLPIYAGVFFFWFTGIFLYVFSRVRRLERAYILFCAFVAAYLLLFVDFFTRRYTGTFFLSYNIVIIAPFLYLFSSVFELGQRGWLYILILFTGLAVYFLNPVRSGEDEIFFIKLLGGVFFVTFIYATSLAIWSERKSDRTTDKRLLWAGRIFNLSLVLAVAMPPVFFFMLYYTPVRIDVNYNALFFLPALFPIIFITLSLRWGLVSFHVPISLAAVRFMYFAFFGFFYWFTIGFSLGEIYQSETTRWGHVWLLVLFLLLIDPVRTALLASLDSYTSSRRKVLDSFLMQSSRDIANPRRVNHFIDRLATSLSEGLGCSWTRIIMSRDLFLDWDSNSDKIIYLPPDDIFWSQARSRLRRRRYPVFTRTFVGPIRDFLQSHGAYLAISMGKFKAGIMIPERRENMPYYSEDIRFLRQFAREAEILIQNYLFLVENVKLKRRERELADNARIQRKIIPGFRQFERFSFWSYSRAYESVTGDYIDLIETGPGSFIVLLGDVSGHGISSGYLVAFARAYLRGMLVERKLPLAEAIGGLNAYFAENYRGNEFITLFALQLTFGSGETGIAYVNAGQHPAVLYRDSTFTRLEDSQRLLGVTETQYTETRLTLPPGPTRIILYSDGAFDVFNKSGKLLGQKKFSDWIESSIDKSGADQLAFLRQRIESYTGSGDDSDDLALIIIQIN